MEKEEFVKNLKLVTSDSIISDIQYVLDKMPLENFPEFKEISEWQSKLAPEEKALLFTLIQKVSEKTVFGVLAVIDGVRVIEDTEEKGEFELYYVKNGKKTLINTPDSEYLHDLL
jgi:hypothetical protein